MAEGRYADRTAVATFLLVVWIIAAIPSLAGADVTVGFRDDAGNLTPSVVTDAALGTLSTSTAPWSAVPEAVPAGAWWSLATGAPHSAVYSLNAGTLYDVGMPARTPLHAAPTAKVNNVPTSFGNTLL